MRWPVPGWVQRWQARRKEAHALRDAYDIDVSRWLVEKAPTPVERWVQEAIDATARWEPVRPDAVGNHIVAGSITSDHLRADGITWNQANEAIRHTLDGIQKAVSQTQQDFVLDHEVLHANPHFRHIHVGIDPGNPDGIALFEGGMDAMRYTNLEDLQLYKKAIRDYGSRPWHLPPRRELEVLKVVDVDEVFWDIASMIDAHRNHCTALDEQRVDVIVDTTSPPIYSEVATYMFDPRHEMGPRQRSWHRQNRNQPTRTARSKRRGRK